MLINTKHLKTIHIQIRVYPVNKNKCNFLNKCHKMHEFYCFKSENSGISLYSILLLFLIEAL